ncbi:PRC-barrel domain-containing protein [Bacillus sp. RAR_GA_16]|uniref:PRC-barrel domain-containing protein n=1 Tax=Bacillus sp. RAR_GA_16 TaxID=2876774 RepID=UPI001CCE0B7D|nr:PRC-barrel domain-containing protein [Bacillus sp. RAR_GA_16]MCA0171520.1 PRC-barrel domain-containing protein [Bacillus sp. RAR_GA_16]
MIKVGKEMQGQKLENESTAEFSVKQVYFDQELRQATFVEIEKKEVSNKKDAIPDHHAGEMLHSIQASGGQFTPDNYPVTDDDRKEQEANGMMIVSYDQLNWQQDGFRLGDNMEDVQTSVLADQCSYRSLIKAEVLTEDGEELGKVKEVVLHPDGRIEGFELSEGFLSDFLSSEQPFLKIDKTVKYQHDKVIVPKDYHHSLK